MTPLEKRAYAQLLRFMVVVAVAMFVAAWTIDYWQAWVFLAVFLASSLAIISHLARHDPRLLDLRMNAGPAAEKERSQKIIQVLAMIAFIAMLLFPALDHRYGWSSMPPSVAVAGDLLVAVGFLAVFFVFKQNSYASSIIEVVAGQQIVTTGPYALVRHPMYSGAILMLIGASIALGSWWVLLMVLPIMAVIVWRLLEEEKFLARNLSGYSEYQNKVKYRLMPFVW